MSQNLAISSFLLLSILGGIVEGASGPRWDYESQMYGKHAWPQRFSTCNGSRQSPINIENATRSNLGQIMYKNYGALPSSVTFTAKNNGHTYTVSFTGFTDQSIPKISGGGLPAGYFKLVGFHFHWGNNNSQGSEHFVDGMSYSAELHLVHLNMKYANVSEAFNHSDGLAVLGVLIQQGAMHNDKYSFLNLTGHNVTFPDMTSNFNLSSMMDLLPSNRTKFYRYNGSLTTPLCNEAVTWTVFANAVEISAEQLNQLRNMKYIDTNNQTRAMVNNHRPLQALHGRMVLVNYESSTGGPSTTTQGPTTTKVSNTTKVSTTDGAFRMTGEYFIFLSSLILLLFLEM